MEKDEMQKNLIEVIKADNIAKKNEIRSLQSQKRLRVGKDASSHARSKRFGFTSKETLSSNRSAIK